MPENCQPLSTLEPIAIKKSFPIFPNRLSRLLGTAAKPLAPHKRWCIILPASEIPILPAYRSLFCRTLVYIAL